LACRLSFCRSIRRGLGDVQELAHVLDRFGAIAAGEQAVVADTVEGLGQDEETADELDRRNRFDKTCKKTSNKASNVSSNMACC